MSTNVCPECGAWEVEKRIVPAGELWAIAVCSTCGGEQRFLRLPLFVVTGPSGAGKTTAIQALTHSLPECVVLESDLLWLVIPEDGPNDYHTFHDIWLRLARSIAQAGRPVLLGGAALPQQLEKLPERRYIGNIHYLALTCDDDVLRARLEARPAWRDSSSEAFIQRCIEFNDWMRKNAATLSPPMTVLDTTHDAPEAISIAVRNWIHERL